MKKILFLALLLFLQNLCGENLQNIANLSQNFNKECYAKQDKSECNKMAMQIFQTAINAADVELAQKLIDENATFFTPVSKDPLYGGAGYISVVNFMRESFSDVKWEIKDLVASDKVVGVYWVCSGTHDKGEFYGKKADGAKFSFVTMNFYYFNDDGKITNDVAGEGLAGLLTDLNILK